MEDTLDEELRAWYLTQEWFKEKLISSTEFRMQSLSFHACRIPILQIGFFKKPRNSNKFMRMTRAPVVKQ